MRSSALLPLSLLWLASPVHSLSSPVSRKSFFSTVSGAAAGLVTSTLGVPEAALADEDAASIVARASKISQAMSQENERQLGISSTPLTRDAGDARTAYDFNLPVSGELVSFSDLIKQNDGKVKAIIAVNIKQDDPIARKNIPELISLATKYGAEGEFVVVASPTDQGYYEADTSTLIRLKLASEYGYGINPVTTLTDKVNLLGTGAHPFWRWLEGSCRTPAGLGRIEGNFEKFLIDGRTGLPVRRYPRKYQPFDMKDDIEALLAGRGLPPAGANYREEWRIAANDAERDTYRFQKGVNVFDQ